MISFFEAVSCFDTSTLLALLLELLASCVTSGFALRTCLGSFTTDSVLELELLLFPSENKSLTVSSTVEFSLETFVFLSF